MSRKHSIEKLIMNLAALRCSRSLIENLCEDYLSEKSIDKDVLQKLINRYKRKMPFHKGRHKSLIPIYIKLNILHEIIFGHAPDTISLFTVRYLANKYGVTPEMVIRFFMEMSDSVQSTICSKLCGLDSVCKKKMLKLNYKRTLIRLCNYNVQYKRLFAE